MGQSLASQGIGTKVLHDANGVVGLQFVSTVGQAAAAGAPANATQVTGAAPTPAAGGTPAKPVGAPAGGASALPNAPAGRVPATIANRGAFLAAFNRGDEFSGKSEPVQDMVLGGYHWLASPKYTNGDLVEVRYGDSEIVQEVVSLAIVGADIGYNAARHVFGPNVNNMGPKERIDALTGMAANAAHNGTLGAIDGAFNLGGAIQNNIAQQVAQEAAGKAAHDAFNDAWDLRELLQHQEANKAKWNQVQAKWDAENLIKQGVPVLSPGGL